MHCVLFATGCGLLSVPIRADVTTTEIRPSDSAAVRTIKGYFRGWEKKDWEMVARHLAADFTFTSPAPDDHLPTEKFRAKCWNQAAHIAHFEFPEIAGDEQHVFAIVQVITTDNRVIRNVEYYTFRDGKIRAIEVFFGGSGAGFPTALPASGK